MRLATDEIINFINFIRTAEKADALDYVNCYGSGDTFGSSDEMGEDPYYEWVTLYFENRGEEHEITFSDTTCYFARTAMWRLYENL